MIRVCGPEDVPLGEGRRVSVDGRVLAIFHTAEGWFALDAVCPHRAGPLADGIVADHSVICPLHERRFDLRSGTELGGDLRVGAYPAQVCDDGVYVKVQLKDIQGACGTVRDMTGLTPAGAQHP